MQSFAILTSRAEDARAKRLTNRPYHLLRLLDKGAYHRAIVGRPNILLPFEMTIAFWWFVQLRCGFLFDAPRAPNLFGVLFVVCLLCVFSIFWFLKGMVLCMSAGCVDALKWAEEVLNSVVWISHLLLCQICWFSGKQLLEFGAKQNWR